MFVCKDPGNLFCVDCILFLVYLLVSSSVLTVLGPDIRGDHLDIRSVQGKFS